MGLRIQWLAVCSVGVLFATAPFTRAEDAVPAEATAAAHLCPADTEVHLKMLAPVASNTHKHGDRFPIEVVEPVRVDNVIVIPAGAQGEGEVVHAAKGGFGGKGGELILVSRFVRVGDQTVKLRSFSAGSGSDRVNLAMGLSFVVIGVFVKGKEIALPAGTDVYAKIASDVSLPSVP